MAYDRKKVSVCRCPECFAKEIDMALRYDPRDDQYYCVKCCFTGTPDQIEEYFTFYKQRKYRYQGISEGVADFENHRR